MSTRKLIAVLLVLPLVAAGAHAQSYTLKIKGGPEVGKSVTVKESAKVNVAFSISLDNNVLMEEKKVVDEEKQYVEKLITSDKGKPTKFSRAYSKALKGDEGNLDKLSYDGKTIVFERKGDRFEASARGDDVEEKDLTELLKGVNNKGDDTGFAPKNAVKVGDTWPLTKEAFGGFLGELKDGADFDKFKGQGKLIKTYEKDGKQWGTLDIALAVPVNKVGPLKLDKSIPFELNLTLDTAIDGSSAATQIKGTLKIAGKSQFEQNGQTIMLDVSVVAVIRRDQSAEK